MHHSDLGSSVQHCTAGLAAINLDLNFLVINEFNGIINEL